VKAVIGLLRSKWLIQFVGIVALAALIWFAGPLIAIAGAVPLASELSRWLAIAATFVLWVIWRLVAQIRAGRKDQRLMADLSSLSAPQKSPEAEASEEEVETLRKTFEEALKVLRTSRAGAKGDRQFLYALPWYVIIGAPGSGKTTALVNSGLRFPLAERLGRNSVKGVSGTRNCDWWFTDQAVLLDTAGRYTTQDSHQAVDSAAWQGFLQLVKKYRPRRPLNGVLVATSMADLMQQTEEERVLHARAIRRRIQELYQMLGMQPPVYMLFTKCDLVAGFNDFFADLTPEERAQVWGETFPAENPEQPQDAVEAFDPAYDALLQRLNQRTFKRIQEERDVQRRSLIFDYPQQMALLKPALMGFLRDVFGTSRYEERFLLRGIYFTSGTQEGTPIDRVMGILAAAFRLDRQSAPVYSGRGKSFFLTRLLQEVVFPEADLAGADPRVERRQRLLQTAAYASALLLSVALIALWTVSYARNRQAIAQVEAQVEAYRSANTARISSQPDAKALLPRLDALLAAREVFKEPGWLMGFGLYQGDKLQSAADHAYGRLLQTSFLPTLKLRLEQRMSGTEGANLEVLYELLRVYLMLGQPEKLDAGIAAPWIRLDWEQQFPTEPQVVARLSTHLDELLQRPPDAIPLNENLISGVRVRLTQVPQVLQIYGHFKNKALLDHSRDLKLGEALGPLGSTAFVTGDGKDIASLTVPGLFTAYGYAEWFLKGSLKFVTDAVSQNWVLGEPKALAPEAVKRLHEDFQKLYLNDYERTWSGLLDAVKVRRAQGINQTVELLDILSRPDTPLRPLLETVERNTSLTKVSALAAALMSKTTNQPEAKPDERTQTLVAAAKQAGLSPDEAPDPVRSVENRFARLNELVRSSGGQPAPLEATLATISALRDYVMQIGGAANRGEQALKSAVSRVSGAGNDVLAQAKIEFARLPEPLKSWLLSLTAFGWSQTLAGAKGQLNGMLKTGVASPCKTAFAGRYPFAGGSRQDATLADFAKFFAPNGTLDQFFQANLKSFIDTTRPEWKQLAMDNQSLGLSPAAIRQFQYAAKIREAFFPAGAQIPQIQFELKPLSLDNDVATFRLSLEGQEAVYRHGPEQVSKFQWPGPATNTGVRLVFETLDGRQASRSMEGPWAWFRTLDAATVERTALPDRFNLTFAVEGLSARYELRAGSVANPFNLKELRSFRCPESL
jgi:type VI secretion system protein ImpL